MSITILKEHQLLAGNMTPTVWARSTEESTASGLGHTGILGNVRSPWNLLDKIPSVSEGEGACGGRLVEYFGSCGSAQRAIAPYA